MSLSPAFLDELRARTSLSALIGRTVKLTRAGREWKACCPFHHEKTPSFTVNDDKGFYHCFGCSAHGDAIRFLTEAQGLPFIDAVGELVAAAGMAMPALDARGAEREAAAKGLHEVVAAAAAWFVEQLEGVGGGEARAYLKRRGVDAEAARAFGLGFAPDGRAGLRRALAEFGDERLIEAGLLIRVDDKEPYDRFRGRLMIPIRDPRGRPIAFGGRTVGEGPSTGSGQAGLEKSKLPDSGSGQSGPKYLNSPETPLFDKGRTLYNLDRAGPAARKVGRLIVVEGYLDVIALAHAGIDEAVAPLGTALTEAQLERLWRVVDVPVLCFDGDAAGRKAAVRAAHRALPLLAPGRSLAFVSLEKGQDPDDLARGGGRSEVEAVLAAAEPMVELIWAHEVALSPLATPEAKAGFKRRLNNHVAAIGDADVRRHYQSDFRARFDAAFFARPAEAFSGRRFGGAKWQPPEGRPSAEARAIGGGGVDGSCARAIMAGLLAHPAMIVTCAEALAALAFDDAPLDGLRTAMLATAYDGQPVDPERLHTICVEAGFSKVLAGLRRANGLAFSFMRGDAKPEVARRDLAMAIEALASRPELDAALEAANARLAMGVDLDGLAEQQRLVAARVEADRTLAALVHGDDD